jgi:hypothetical protein
MSYEEEDTCQMRRRIPVHQNLVVEHAEEDTCHMRRRIHVI